MRALPVALGLALLAAARPAAASYEYPGRIKAKYGLADLPLCTVCHATLNGGPNTVVQPFGVTMVGDYGLTSAPSDLEGFLDQLEGDAKDSDGDGSPDVVELRAGKNPSAAGDSGVPTPGYGCFEVGGTVAAAHAPPRLASVAFAGLCAAALVARRRRCPLARPPRTR